MYGTVQVESIKDYNLYCHYVAGLVGIGLSQLFASSGADGAGRRAGGRPPGVGRGPPGAGRRKHAAAPASAPCRRASAHPHPPPHAPRLLGLEDASLSRAEGLANDMGLFLQKTNIIRDYLVRSPAGQPWWWAALVVGSPGGGQPWWWAALVGSPALLMHCGCVPCHGRLGCRPGARPAPLACPSRAAPPRRRCPLPRHPTGGHL